MKHRRRPQRPVPGPARVNVRAVSEVPAVILAGSVFALLAIAAMTLVKVGGGNDGLANTGSPVNAVTIAVVVLLVLAGVAFVVIGQTRKKNAPRGDQDGSRTE